LVPVWDSITITVVQAGRSPMTEQVIKVHHLTKHYLVPEREPGLGAALKSLVRKQYRRVEAVSQIDFCVKQGEMVGFIGPNGAGKTTTLKMLSGLLHPTSGTASVLGFTPWKRQQGYLKQISMVLGNKSQMLWDIPPLDTFRILAEIYRVPAQVYSETLDELVNLLEMEDLLQKPVRNFSLGERMKCELVAGLLHRPAVMFLDEPTLGLDISMQSRLRRFLTAYNQRSGVTIMLTSHYMADVQALCPRVILIHHGEILYDGELQGLADQLAPFKLIKLTLSNRNRNSVDRLSIPSGAMVIEEHGNQIVLRVSRSQAPGITENLLKRLPIADLSVENPPIEAVIDQIYQDGDV
jgi:ABC-2 type transport system ATP-binding protein